MFDRIFEHEVDDTHCVGLADAVHPANALFQAHRVPGYVIVDDHMAELEVETLTTSFRQAEDADILSKCVLWTRLRSFMSMEPLRHTTSNPCSVRNS